MADRRSIMFALVIAFVALIALIVRDAKTVVRVNYPSRTLETAEPLILPVPNR